MDIENGSSGSVSLCNTKSKRETAKINWSFTWNNYTDDDYSNLIDLLNEHEAKYIVGKEIGSNGTPHLQGYIHWQKKRRLTELKKINSKIHWEPSKKCEAANIKYCSKEGNYVISGFDEPEKLDCLKDDELYEWQKNILKILKDKPDNRTIHWIWEPVGKTGKTQFSKYLCIKHKAVYIKGKKNDILYAVAEQKSSIYIIDLSRTMEDHVPYEAIEDVKNGIFFSGKYESKQIIRNSPHIIIFANFEPDKYKLSLDRWKITAL